MNRLVMTRRGGEVCTAMVSDGKVSQLILEPDTADSLLGDIYIGKVQKVVSNINAAFTDMGPGCTGYYNLQERWKPERLRTGDELVMQVSRDAVETKAPVVTERLSFTGRCCALVVGKTGIGFSAEIHDASYKARLRSLLECGLIGTEDLGVIVRTNAVAAENRIVREELAEPMGTWQRLSADTTCQACYSCLYRALPGYIAAIRSSFCRTLEEIITGVPKYHRELGACLEMYQKEDANRLTLYENSLPPLSKLYSLETAFEKALGKNIWLKSGGYLVIEPTETMTVIDVNTGKYSDRKNMQDTVCRMNMETTDEIGRQLRLRNLSGIITVDFIDMEREEDEKAFLAYLGDAVSKDLVKTTAVDMTTLNLVELTREKMRRPLHEQIWI